MVLFLPLRAYCWRRGSTTPQLSDEDAVARAQILSSKRRARLMATSCGTVPVWSSGVPTRALRRRRWISRGYPLTNDFRREKAQRHGSQNDRPGPRVSIGEVRASFSAPGNS